jgi:transcriptional regulator with XRE-family HTH domain
MLSTVIRELREKADMTQEQLAKRAKVSRGYLADLEAGHRTNPSVPVLRRLAKALGVPPNRVLDVYRLAEHPATYIECPAHRFHAPVFSRVRAVDPVSLAPAPEGTPSPSRHPTSREKSAPSSA